MNRLLIWAVITILILALLIFWVIANRWLREHYPTGTCTQTISVSPGDDSKLVHTTTIVGIQIGRMYLAETSTGQMVFQDQAVWEQIEPGTTYCVARDQSFAFWPIVSVVQGACTDLSDHCGEVSQE